MRSVGESVGNDLAKGEKIMLTQGSRFAKYSKVLCWVVSFIWLLLAIAAFTGDGDNAVLNGFLWLIGALAFAASAMYLSRSSQSSE